MKILYFSSTSYIDADLSLLKSFREKGHEVVFVLHVFPNGLRSTLIDIPKIYPHTGIFDASVYGDAITRYQEFLGDVKIYVSNITTNSISPKSLLLEWDIYKLIKKEKPDVIHRVGIPGIFSIPFLKFYKNLVVTVHDPVPHENEEKRKLLIMRRLVLRNVKNIVLLNKEQTNGFLTHYSLNGRRKNISYSRLGNYEVLRMFGKDEPQEYRNILFYGRISQYKGVDYLLEAFSKIKEQFRDVKLIIAGKGDFHFDISPYQNDKQIEFRNRFITLDELGTLIRNCEFVVCPYVSATQSGVVASSLALNKPLIVTNVGGLPEMIENGKSGMVVPAKESASLAEAMSFLLSNTDALHGMISYIQESSHCGRSTWSKIADDYLKVYNVR